MRRVDWWLVGFGLRCLALAIAQIATWLFVVPTLFDRHSDAADAVAALIALVALVGGTVASIALTREARPLIEDREP